MILVVSTNASLVGHPEDVYVYTRGEWRRWNFIEVITHFYTLLKRLRQHRSLPCDHSGPQQNQRGSSRATPSSAGIAHQRPPQAATGPYEIHSGARPRHQLLKAVRFCRFYSARRYIPARARDRLRLRDCASVSAQTQTLHASLCGCFGHSPAARCPDFDEQHQRQQALPQARFSFYSSAVLGKVLVTAAELLV